MYFHSFADFLAQGHHGFYVWLAYGVTLFVLLLLAGLIWQQDRQQKAAIRRRLATEARRRARQLAEEKHEPAS